MAIEDILRALEDQARAECGEILTEAKEHAAHIASEGDREAERISEAYVRHVEQNATKKSARTLNSARLEAKTRLSKIKGAGLESVFGSVSEQLGSMRGSAEYPRLFKALAQEALAGTGSSAVVHVDPADVDLARQTLAEMGVSTEIVGDLKSAGGVVVELDDGRVVRRNTFEDRLERAKVALQADAAKALLS